MACFMGGSRLNKWQGRGPRCWLWGQRQEGLWVERWVWARQQGTMAQGHVGAAEQRDRGHYVDIFHPPSGLDALLAGSTLLCLGGWPHGLHRWALLPSALWMRTKGLAGGQEGEMGPLPGSLPGWLPWADHIPPPKLTTLSGSLPTTALRPWPCLPCGFLTLAYSFIKLSSDCSWDWSLSVPHPGPELVQSCSKLEGDWEGITGKCREGSSLWQKERTRDGRSW